MDREESDSIESFINSAYKLYKKGFLKKSVDLFESNRNRIIGGVYDDTKKAEFFLSFAKSVITYTYMENQSQDGITEIFDICKDFISNEQSDLYAQLLILKAENAYYNFLLSNSPTLLENAAGNLQAAVEILKGNDNTALLSQAYFYQGLIFDKSKQDEKAKKSLKKSYRLAKKSDLKIEMSDASRYIGIKKEEEGTLSEALEYYKESLKLRESTGYSIGIPFIMFNLGDIYLKLEDRHKALKCYKFGYELGLGIKNSRCQMIGSLGIGRAYLRLNNFEEAIPYLETAVDFSTKLNDMKIKDLAQGYLANQDEMDG